MYLSSDVRLESDKTRVLFPGSVTPHFEQKLDFAVFKILIPRAKYQNRFIIHYGLNSKTLHCLRVFFVFIICNIICNIMT